ncbi:PQQ-dependent sugar dehydrogenase [Nocardioides sp. zg-ZUI104]|uniref:PQQ-dependent sugar dehydrogenase n=1 Tax=Nocardioides faecalis TaxID=2803858 RepID=UPI001BCCEC97|nr:PQQ-dependent sugar dehydrogenase [Nocardioides faecalis]MBS4754646.1 PQQ-dependent sugar dehydrogenase [Nocardioides faecalis]
MARRLAVLCSLACSLVLLATALTAPPASGAARGVALDVAVVAGGLDHPWEVAELPGGRLLVTERDRAALVLVSPSGDTRRIGFPSSRVFTRGETGLLGLAVDPSFERNRRIYTCSGWRRAGGGHDIRVMAWTLDAGLRTATLRKTLLRGLPSNATGRHGGCRLLVARSGALMVGTGDATNPRNPQNRRSLGGKVLRLSRFTGKPWRGNPWAGGQGKRRYVVSYGHRNVQGLAQRADGSIWAVEHGTYRDDEINRIRARGNYGWQPGPGYDESRPMTDKRLPGAQVSARWRSGRPTIAPSGADFVRGTRWGGYRGALAVAVLKGERLMFVKLSRSGKVRWTRSPKALRGFGRLRDVTSTASGDLLVTTDNGGGRDVVLRIRPRS